MATSKPVVFLALIFLAWSVPIGHAQSPRRVEIIAKRFTYDPDTITLRKGEPVVLVLHSIDVTHGIKIEAFNIKSDDIKKDKETEVRFTPQQTGHFEAQCSHFCGKGHGTMKLQIDVVPQSGTVDLPFGYELELPRQCGKGAKLPPPLSTSPIANNHGFGYYLAAMPMPQQDRIISRERMARYDPSVDFLACVTR